MKKLTNKQIDTLCFLREEKLVSKDDHRLHNNTMNGLYFKGLVELISSADGEFWKLTNGGIKYFND